MNNSTTSFYNEFAGLYPLVDVFLKPQKSVLIREINKHPPGDLLDIGVGNGSHLRHYENHNIVGIDTSAGMLDRAARNNPGHARLFLMNGESLTFQNNSFDYVVLSHVIAVSRHPDQLLREVHRILKPQGKVFILNHFTPDNWLGRVDKAFALISDRFHFRSAFFLEDISAIKRFTLVKETPLGPFSYFKLLILKRP